ncbi:GntR family transcriptional regulator [Spelaeicoccus albus]|uniref:DNA-binding GntR family transcriptional regulator n=1 Tax=Spelaeicoccus albus TaxID=1280376 RepID=A0A7Z0D0S9_9MICO|nr:GntR family transcriptional regulator [Spelaeicoccus albus]NYI65783.1 DNA-binding GntR family transcriptional regulator [Spelaeicoccus albus]
MDAPLDDLETGAPAEHAHRTTWAAGVLRRWIGAGRLKPAMKLSEYSLAATLHVSRNTLREAFTVLAGESIITRIPNRGVYVAAPNADDVREMYKVRRMVEPAAVLWGPGSVAREVEAMEAAIERARIARESNLVPDMAGANNDFHRAVVALSGSADLQNLMVRTLAQMRLVFHAMSSIPDFHSHYVERNAELVELIKSGDRPRAADVLREYLDISEAELLEHMSGEGS